MNRRILIVVAALLVSALAVPLTLHELDLRHIRDSTFAAVRFAAIADPSKLSQLPVPRWEEVAGVAAPSVRKMAWGRYEMYIPRGTTMVRADVDLRPTMAALLLGMGGWLRVIVCSGVGAGILYVGMRRDVPRGKKKLNASTLPSTAMQGALCTQVSLLLFNEILGRLDHCGLVLDSDHRLVTWNAAIQNDAPGTIGSSDLHLLDLAAILPWGKQLIEAVDTHALDADVDAAPYLLIIKEGERICVTAG